VAFILAADGVMGKPERSQPTTALSAFTLHSQLSASLQAYKAGSLGCLLFTVPFVTR
jgi:hypothetical protein